MNKVLPQDTTIGSHSNPRVLIEKLQNFLLSVDYEPPMFEFLNSGTYVPLFLAGVTQAEKDIEQFIMPVLVKDASSGKEDERYYLVSDVRPLVNTTKIQDGVLEDAAKDRANLGFMVHQNILTCEMLDEHLNGITVLNRFGGRVYSSWISGALATTVSMNPGERLDVAIVASLFYQSLMMKDKPSTSDIHKMVVVAAKHTGAKPNYISKIMDMVDRSPDNIDGLVKNIKTIVDNPKTNGLNSSLLVNMLVTSWYGINSTINLPMAVEHIPTWLSIVYSCLNEKSFKRSGVSRLIDGMPKRGMDKEFTMAFKAIVEGYKA